MMLSELNNFINDYSSDMIEAVSQLPIYSSWPNFQRNDSFDSWWKALPFLEKIHITDGFPYNFSSHSSPFSFNHDEHEIVESSGTSEHKIQIIRPIDFKQEWSDVARRYHKIYEQYPVKEALLTTLNCSRTQCNLKGATYAERIQGERLILNRSPSPLLWDDAECKRIIDEIILYAPNVLTVHPLYFLHLERWVRKNKVTPPRVPVIFFSYDFASVQLFERAKKWVTNGVYSQYGMTEVFTAIVQCDCGNYHLVEDGLHAEVIRYGKPVAEGEVGELVLTSMRNSLMPIIRYRTGDLVRVAEQKPCDCGQDSFIIDSLEGRINELTIANNKLITTRTLDKQFIKYPEVDYYQLRQSSDGLTELNVVIADEANSFSDIGCIKNDISTLYQRDVNVRVVNEIPMHMNGKYSYIISGHDPEQNFCRDISIT